MQLKFGTERIALIAFNAEDGLSREASACAPSSREASVRLSLLSFLRVFVQDSEKGEGLCSAQGSKHSFTRTRSWCNHAVLWKVTWISVAFCTARSQILQCIIFSGDPAHARCYFRSTSGRTKADGPHCFGGRKWNGGDKEVPWVTSELLDVNDPFPWDWEVQNSSIQKLQHLSHHRTELYHLFSDFLAALHLRHFPFPSCT